MTQRQHFGNPSEGKSRRGVEYVFVVFPSLVAFTPKALYSKAQGREAWRAHPGFRSMKFCVPQRGSTICVHSKN